MAKWIIVLVTCMFLWDCAHKGHRTAMAGVAFDLYQVGTRLAWPVS